jgi:O-antigen ligase
MGVGLIAAILLIRHGYRTRVIAAGVGIALGVFMMADQVYINRQQTTSKYENDGSALQRLETWNAAYRLVKDRPLGAGGRGFHLLSPRYIPDIVQAHGGDLRAPHNTWVMVACEWGIAGFFCFVAINASALWMLERLKWRVESAR